MEENDTVSRALASPVILGPSMFPFSKSFTINGGTFNVYGGTSSEGSLEASRWSKCMRVKGAVVKVIPRHEIRPQHMIYKRQGSRFNSAFQEGSEVLVQTFEGRHAKEQWEQVVTTAHRLVNAHILNLRGVSPNESNDDPRYIVFDGTSSRSTHHLLASLLRTGTQEASLIGMRTVYGIASGLDFLFQQNISFARIVESYNIFSNEQGHTVLSFTPDIDNVIVKEEELEVSNTDNMAISMCTFLIQKTFNNANHVIYREKLDRHSEGGNSKLEDLLSFPNIQNKSTSQAAPNSLFNDMEGHGGSCCRREIVWRFSASQANASLACLLESYQDRLESLTGNLDAYDSISLPQRPGSLWRNRWGVHTECGGYSRQEITLNPDAFRSAVVIYERPSNKEICFVCGQVVRLPRRRRSVLQLSNWACSSRVHLRYDETTKDGTVWEVRCYVNGLQYGVGYANTAAAAKNAAASQTWDLLESGKAKVRTL